uniref:Uncharacterized protein n=1 Tax=Siphoviridae sp. ctqED62 TaxID=2826468 RepID=A0A8S5MRB0_9CAUD|nr:MAG TPA: hypothetical protein [Siphoviridae sp. ctqED62]
MKPGKRFRQKGFDNTKVTEHLYFSIAERICQHVITV